MTPPPCLTSRCTEVKFFPDISQSMSENFFLCPKYPLTETLWFIEIKPEPSFLKTKGASTSNVKKWMPLE